MSTEFNVISNYYENIDPVDSRKVAVEAALVLMNSRISACSGNQGLAEALDPEIISTLADNIEIALKNTK